MGRRGRYRPRGLALGFIADQPWGTVEKSINGEQLELVAIQDSTFKRGLEKKLPKKYVYLYKSARRTIWCEGKTGHLLSAMGYDQRTRRIYWQTFTDPTNAQKEWLERNDYYMVGAD